ncbi:hypothetical protein HC022_22375 [Salipiger sp. HF18]|mgnify:FL=1|uniref:hypothetical protein n=1 Tax=Salipiger sp. HF18 TaxID=2721557 RepID=UPI00142D66A2|nr:hypothetical protein [Salipiger sp. HF18]NIY98863.1 hypothetical protein [Salipiger sp. HF18]
MTTATMTASTDFLALARGRRIEALTARNLLLCDRHVRPEIGTLDRVLRFLGL